MSGAIAAVFLRHHPLSGDVLWRPVCNDPGCGCDRDPLGPQNPMSWSIRRLVRGAPPLPPLGGSAGQWRPSGVVPIGRVEAFSDGVFAIAITLLVLELHVPTGHSPLLKALEGEWPRYLGSFVSFAFIGGVWVAHSTRTRFNQGRRR